MVGEYGKWFREWLETGHSVTREEYIERWYDWLLEKWQNRTYGPDDE